jgi:hypothetical protein
MSRPNLAWQESCGESNFSPIKLARERTDANKWESTIPALSAEQFQSVSVHERLYMCGRSSPTSLPALLASSPYAAPTNFIDGVTKFTDHRKNVHISPIKVRPTTTLPEGSTRINLGNPQLQFAHESMIRLQPPSELVSAYKTGLQVHSPLKIVVHQKRGVKLPKISPEKPSNGVTRNYHGGYYSTAA